MNYKKHYYLLIQKGLNRFLEEYTESHHIIPRCMGGTNEKENLVNLTPEEHYVAHQLLIKIYPDNYALVKAAAMMIPNRPSNKLYGWLRRRFSIAQSVGQTGEDNSQFGSQWIHNKELKISRKRNKNEPLDLGWEIGRKLNFDPVFNNCKFCNILFNPKNSEIFCSNLCKRNRYSTGINKMIDDNLDFLIEQFKINKSIDRTLRNFGISGIRAGNSYFSDILKSKGYTILKRRNTN